MSTPQTRYAQRDYTAILDAIIAQAREQCPEITDWNYSASNSEIARLMASSEDAINGYVDQVFMRMLWRYAPFMQDLIEMGALVGGFAKLGCSAATILELARKAAGDDAITIPRYSPFGRQDGLEYLTLEQVTIQPGETTVAVDALQGVLVEQTFAATDFRQLRLTQFKQVNLGPDVAANTVEVWHGDPLITWAEVESFYRSDSEHHDFALELNGDTGDVWLILGDGTQGQGPPAEALHVRYIRTAGAAGNCGANTIYLVPDSLDDLITCTNTDPAAGGTAPESHNAFRRRLPTLVRAQNRMVTRPDYEAMIKRVPGVLHVQAIDASSNLFFLDPVKQQKRVPREYTVLVVVPDDGQPMSEYLKDLIYQQCEEYGHHGGWRGRYILLDAVYVPVDVSVRIGIAAGYQPAPVTSAAYAAINDLLSVQNRTLAGTLPFAELHECVAAVPGVLYPEFDSPKTGLVAQDGEIHSPGTIVVTQM